MKAASGKEITPPVRRSVQAARRRWACAREPRRRRSSTSATSQDARALDGHRPRRRSATITDVASAAPTSCSCRAARTPLDQTGARRDRRRDRPAHRGRQAGRRNASYGGSYVFGGHRDRHAPVPSRRRRHLPGRQAAWTRRSRASCARSARASRCRSTSVGRERPRRRPGRRRRQAAERRCATSPTTSRPATPPRCAAPTSRGWTPTWTRCSRSARRNGALTNRLDAAGDAPRPDRGDARRSSSRTPRTPTSPRR